MRPASLLITAGAAIPPKAPLKVCKFPLPVLVVELSLALDCGAALKLLEDIQDVVEEEETLELLEAVKLFVGTREDNDEEVEDDDGEVEEVMAVLEEVEEIVASLDEVEDVTGFAEEDDTARVDQDFLCMSTGKFKPILGWRNDEPRQVGKDSFDEEIVVFAVDWGKAERFECE